MNRFLKVFVFAHFVLCASFVSAATINAPVGAFNYSYNSQTAADAGAADPNATLGGSLAFNAEGNPNFANYYYTLDGSQGTLEYEFQAAIGATFTGNMSILARLAAFDEFPPSAIVAALSTDGGAFVDYETFTATGAIGEFDYDTNVINVNGANKVNLRFTIDNVAGGTAGAFAMQLFRQQLLGGIGGTLDPTPFTVSATVAAVPEPSTLVLALFAFAGIAGLYRRKLKKAAV